MKYLLTLALTVCGFLPMAQAAKYEEGTHYEVIKEVATQEPEVMEYFSYFCPHCYKFYPFVAQIKERVDPGVTFKKNHVEFLGGDMGPEMTRAFAVAEVLKVEPELSQAMFSALHDKKQRMANVDDIKAVFETVGIDAAKYDSAAKSFSVNGKLKQMARNTEQAEIRGTPAIVVNGKYKVIARSVPSLEEYSALVNYLVKKQD